MTAAQLASEALMMLEGKGAILDVAKRITRILDQSNTPGAIIGGVAVVLHGHIRTTADVDVFIPGSTQAVSARFTDAGMDFSPQKKEFVCDGVPVHLVTAKETGIEPAEFTRIDDVRTISLADLINLKLTAGLRHVTRAQDIADVIGLIRAHRLTSQFAGKLHKPLRAEFRKLVKAIQKEG